MSHGMKIKIPKILQQPKKSRHLFLKFLATVVVIMVVKMGVTFAIYGPPPAYSNHKPKADVIDLHCGHVLPVTTDAEADHITACYLEEAKLRLRASNP